MNKLVMLIALCLVLMRAAAQVGCSPGYVERNVKCNGKIVVKCVPQNYSCDKCWALQFAPCPGKNSGGLLYYSSYERALQAAQKESSNWKDGRCTWYDNTKYKIYLDDSKSCTATPDGNAALKNDLLSKIKPFLQRYKDEIANYRRYFNGQPYKPGAVFKEYETQLKQAEENVRSLENMLINMTDNNLRQIENAFNDLQREQQNLKQADAGYRTQINTVKQDDLNRQQAEEAQRLKQQQLEQQRKSQEKIDAQMRKSERQADMASTIIDGLGSILGTIQANQARKSIAEDNNKRTRQFEELKRKVQNEEGELASCSSCYGEGYRSCGTCGSAGKKTCGVCYGKAGQTCTVCRGSGTYQVGTVKLSCTSCFGKGTRNCSYCGNTGQALCTSCNGLGKNQCFRCSGTGQEFKRTYGQPYQPLKADPVPNPNPGPDQYSAPVAPKVVRYEQQSYSLNMTSDWLNKKWNAENQYVTNILSTGTGYRAVTSSNTNYTAQLFQTSASFPGDSISKYWYQNFRITDIAGDYTSGWRVVLSKNSGYDGQSYKLGSDIATAYIKEYWDKGYYLTTVASDKNNWVFVMSTSTPYTAQSYKSDVKIPAEYIKEYWDKDYYISSAAFNKGQWMIVMSRTALYETQSYMTDTAFPEAWVKEKWNAGYRITQIAEAPDKWLVVMSKFR